MPTQRLKEFLDKQKVKYVSCKHSQAFTAQEVAASAHIPGKQIAKTVMVTIDGQMAMAVLPATDHVDLRLMKKAIGAKKVELASEREFKDLFPDCEIGAMPPFGNLYDLDVYVAENLREDEEIAFNAGTHTEIIRIAYLDFEKLVQPHVVALSLAV
ncbi:aminoacyl-tRNA deacylase [Candidatus Neomarinimicrobiota bacterium]